MYNAALVRLEQSYFEPQEDISKICCKCSVCEEDIYEDDDCYELLGLTICQCCIDDAHGYASLE